MRKIAVFLLGLTLLLSGCEVLSPEAAGQQGFLGAGSKADPVATPTPRKDVITTSEECLVADAEQIQQTLGGDQKFWSFNGGVWTYSRSGERTTLRNPGFGTLTANGRIIGRGDTVATDKAEFACGQKTDGVPSPTPVPPAPTATFTPIPPPQATFTPLPIFPTPVPQVIQPPSAACPTFGTVAWHAENRLDGQNYGVAPIGGLNETCWIVGQVWTETPIQERWVFAIRPGTVVWIAGHRGGTAWFFSGTDDQVRANLRQQANELLVRDGDEPTTLVILPDEVSRFRLVTQIRSK